MIRSLAKKTQRYTSFAEYLFFILTVFTCTYFVYRDFEIRMIYGYAVLGVIWMIHMLRRGYTHKKMVLGSIKACFLFLCICIFVSFILPNANRDGDAVAYVIAMILCALYLVAAEPQEKETKLVLYALLTTAVGVAVYVIFFVIFEDLYWETVYKIVSPTQQEYLSYYVPKGYAITINGCTYTDYILMFGIAAACAFCMTKKKWDASKITLVLCVAVFFITILLVGRRGELLGAAATLVLFYILIGNKKQRWVRFGFCVGIAILAFGLIVLSLPLLKEIDVLYRYVLTFENLLSGSDITSGRTELYALAWSLFKEKPLFGIGLAQFENYITPEFHAIHGADVRDVHCIYLQFLCECGIFGAVFRIVPLAYCYVQTVRQLSRLRGRTGISRKLDAAIQANTASFIIQTFLLILGIYDPCFTRIIFWCFYSIAVLFLVAACLMEGCMFNDKITTVISNMHHCSKKLFVRSKEKG